VTVDEESGISRLKSPYPVDETADRIQATLQEKGLATMCVVDHSAEARRVGLEMRPTKLIIFGSPRAGTPVMLAAPDTAIDLIVEHANRAQSPLTAVVIEFYGGAAARVGNAETAFAQRQTEYDIGIMAQWTDAGESDRHIAWARDMSDALKPHSSGGYLLNFLAEESPDTIRAAFGSNYARLVELKSKYDPSNFFNLNQNVKPAH